MGHFVYPALLSLDNLGLLQLVRRTRQTVHMHLLKSMENGLVAESEDEVGAATAVDADAEAVISPGAALDAERAAALVDHAYAAAGIHVAEVPDAWRILPLPA